MDIEAVGETSVAAVPSFLAAETNKVSIEQKQTANPLSLYLRPVQVAAVEVVVLAWWL